jgi:hypothetical protein
MTGGYRLVELCGKHVSHGRCRVPSEHACTRYEPRLVSGIAGRYNSAPDRAWTDR